MIYINCRSFPVFTKWLVPWNFFLNGSSVQNTSLFNFCKKKIVRQFDVRSYVTQDIGDTRLFEDIRFADLVIKSYNSVKSTVFKRVERKWMAALFTNFTAKWFLSWDGFCLNTGKRFLGRFYFEVNRKTLCSSKKWF